MQTRDIRMVDVSGEKPKPLQFWDPIVISKQAIDEEIARLCEAPRPSNGWRSSSIVHPNSSEPGLGLTPGISVTINVLLPGESTVPVRRNSSGVEICNRGCGTALIGDREIKFEQWDIWTVPSMQTCIYRNDGDEPCVRLTYSNAPLLEKLEVHYVQENPLVAPRSIAHPQSGDAKLRPRADAPNIVSPGGGAMLGYEYTVDIDVVPNPALHWPLSFYQAQMTQAQGDGKRNLMTLYNPATERRNGTTHSFFAAVGAMAPGTPERPVGRGHRHSSSAINYYIKGGPGKSVVEGSVVEWNEGDLMLSAPGWAEHAHYFPEIDQPRLSLTVQDHPLHIGMESLIWQEDMTGEILTLGSEAGVTGYVGPREKASV